MTRTIGATALAAIALLAFTPDTQARDMRPGPDRGPSKGWFGKRPHDHREEDARRRFFAHPRSSFTITLGSGYAGRGYYYGPPNMPYYYQGSGISYYSTRERVPNHYWGPSYNTLEVRVQRELSRRGFYSGPADGYIGPGTRAAISRYQRARGIKMTGGITNDLLRSLDIKR